MQDRQYDLNNVPEQEFIEIVMDMIGEHKPEYLEKLLVSNTALSRATIMDAFEKSGVLDIYIEALTKRLGMDDGKQGETSYPSDSKKLCHFNGVLDAVERADLRKKRATTINPSNTLPQKPSQKWDLPIQLFYSIKMENESVILVVYGKEEVTEEQFKDALIFAGTRLNIIAYDQTKNVMFCTKFPKLPLEFRYLRHDQIEEELLHIKNAQGADFVIFKDLSCIKNIYFVPYPIVNLREEKFRLGDAGSHISLDLIGPDFVNTLLDLLRRGELLIGKDHSLYTPAKKFVKINIFEEKSD